jgi:tetratricopeptide (TPR) repeat protein
MKGWWRKALEASQKAVEANPNSAIACVSLSENYRNIGELDRAFLFAKKAIALDPASGFHCGHLGNVYIALDDPGQAEVWLKKALELQPDLDVAHRGLIYLYLASGEFNKAIEQSQMLLSKLPDSPGAIWIAALAELFSGHFEKAQEHYQKIAAQTSYRNSETCNQLGFIYWKGGRTDEATQLFQENSDRLQKRLEEGDESSDIRVLMAEIYAVQGNKEEALRWLEKAFDAGWLYYNYASRYPLLENIRDDERFKRIIDDIKAKVAEMRRRVEQLERDSSQ